MKLSGSGVSFLQKKTGRSSTPVAPGMSAPGGVDKIYLGRGSRPPGKCPPGYQLSSSGPGLQKSWYCNRVVSPVSAPQPAPVLQAPPPPPAPAPIVTVSPSFQQTFTPQVSPVITAQIQSPGASATGAPVQQASTPQSASGGAPVMGPSGPSAREIALREKIIRMEAAQQARADFKAGLQKEAATQIPEAPLSTPLPSIPTIIPVSATPGITSFQPNVPISPPAWQKFLPWIALAGIASYALISLTGTKGKRNE